MVANASPDRPKLSVCIICRDEQARIERCLSAVQWADEIVVVDSGSRDRTLEIAGQFTDSIYAREDWQGYGVQRQRAEQLAKHEWIFALDADEVVSDELAHEIQQSLVEAKVSDVFLLNRLTHFCGRFIYHSGWYPDRVARIYNKNHCGYNDKSVHESVNVAGANQIRLQADLLHYTFSDLNTYLVKRNGYAFQWAIEQHEKGKQTSTLKATVSSLFAFFRHYVLRRGFLDGRAGFLISVIQMQYTFNKYMQLIYMNQNRDADDRAR